MVDMAHIAGLVAAGLHPNPVPVADVVTTTTHKTLRGPRGGMILTAHEEYAKKLNSAIFPGIQGGPLEHVIAGKAVALGEILDPSFKDYAQQIIKNAAAMAEVFKKSELRVISGGTENHVFLLDLNALDVSGKWAQERLEKVSITVNKNSIPNDQRSFVQTSGIRVGTPAITTRGLKEDEARHIADLIIRALKADESELPALREEAISIVAGKPFNAYQH